LEETTYPIVLQKSATTEKALSYNFKMNVQSARIAAANNGLNMMFAAPPPAMANYYNNNAINIGACAHGQQGGIVVAQNPALSNLPTHVASYYGVELPRLTLRPPPNNHLYYDIPSEPHGPAFG
jgi:hypothetical protein